MRKPYQVYTHLFKITIGKSLCLLSRPSPDKFRNLGLFKYWTLSNAPLFLLATPVTFILIISGKWALSLDLSRFNSQSIDKVEGRSITQQVLWNLAITQLALTAITLTTAHVQIITRISSAYPVWVWYLAISCKEGSAFGKRFVSFMVLYGVIQAELFASFLPPA